MLRSKPVSKSKKSSSESKKTSVVDKIKSFVDEHSDLAPEDVAFLTLLKGFNPDAMDDEAKTLLEINRNKLEKQEKRAKEFADTHHKVLNKLGRKPKPDIKATVTVKYSYGEDQPFVVAQRRQKVVIESLTSSAATSVATSSESGSRPRSRS